MDLTYFDTLTGSLEAWSPPGRRGVEMYVCGPTVYAPSHVGHARNYLLFDGVRRLLESAGSPVHQVQNITDFEDKITHRAAALGISWRTLARREERDFWQQLRVLGIRPSEHRPRSSDFVPTMIRILRALERKGMTYRKGGALYFRASSAPAGRDFPAAELLAEHAVADPGGIDTAEADNPLDFALWKPSEAPAPCWNSPWGRGMPGWHIECFAMAERYLTLPMDLHGGGLDLVFPHHYAENLLCRAMTGRAFAQRFLHGAFVTRGDQKMSKSLGNLVLLSDALTQLTPGGLRWYLWGTHYRDRLEYDPRKAREADVRWRETQRTFSRLFGAEGDTPAQSLADGKEEVRSRMAQDLDFGGALERLEAFSAGIRARRRPGLRRGDRGRARKELQALSALLGLPLLPEAPGPTSRTRVRT